MAASREAILAALGRPSAPEAVPRYAGPTLAFADPVAAFGDALAAAGGALVVLPDRLALDRWRAEVPPEVPVLHGGPAVAESGAVWWVPHSEQQRRAAFLAERVILLVPRAQLVPDLHSAYRRIDPADGHYGCFVSGPSKTADIEQALVIGAHGPCALDVVLWGQPDD